MADTYVRSAIRYFGGRLISICFFGSVVRGEASPQSDLDVLVVAGGLREDLGSRMRETKPIREEVRESEASRSLRSKGRSSLVSAIYLTPEEAKGHPPIMLDIADHGIIAYDKDGFLERVLATIRERLKELNAQKVVCEKGYYWILKPDLKPGEVVEI